MPILVGSLSEGFILTISLRNRVLIGVFGICYLTVLMSLYIQKPPNPDQGIFDYIAWVGTTGGRYYVDVAEQNFPGEMLLHDLAFRVFGVNIRAYRSLDFVIATLGAFALCGLLRMGGYRTGALFGAAFFLAGYVSSNAWMSGQRDVVAANLLLCVGYFFMRRLNGGGRLWIVPLSAVLFFALLLRPTYLLFPVALMVVDWCLLRRYARHFGTSLVDGVLVAALLLLFAAALVGWGAYSGSLSAFWEQVIMFNTQAYAAHHSLMVTLARMAYYLTSYLLFIPAIVLAIAQTERHRRREAPLLILIGLAILALVSTLAQNKGFMYHLGALIPPVFGLTGVALWMAIDTIREHRKHALRHLALFGIPVVLGLLGLIIQVKSLGPQIRSLVGRETYMQMMAREPSNGNKFTWADLVAASDYARNATGPLETVLVWDSPVSINFLAQRRSPSRFITYRMLLMAEPPFLYSDAWTREFTDVLDKTPPRVVFIKASDVRAKEVSQDGGNPAIVDALSRFLATRCDFVRDFGSLSAYRLKD